MLHWLLAIDRKPYLSLLSIHVAIVVQLLLRLVSLFAGLGQRILQFLREHNPETTSHNNINVAYSLPASCSALVDSDIGDRQARMGNERQTHWRGQNGVVSLDWRGLRDANGPS